MSTPAQRIRAGSVRPWLPPSAFQSGIAEQVLGELIREWSSTWSSKAQLRLKGSMRQWNGEGTSWKKTASGLALSVPADAQLFLAGLMLGEQFAEAKLGGADRRLVEDLARRSTEALAEALAETVDLPRRQAWQPGSPAEFHQSWCGGIGGNDGKPIIRIAIASDLLVRVIRRAAPAPAGAAPLSSLDGALEDQVVAVSAFLGRCAVRISDLATLEPGDVLCLDGATDEPVKLALENTPGPAACKIEQDGEGLRLRLVE